MLTCPDFASFITTTEAAFVKLHSVSATMSATFTFVSQLFRMPACGVAGSILALEEKV